MRRSLIHAVLVVALIVSACKGSDSSIPNVDVYSTVATGANVIPPGTSTTTRASASFNTATLAYTYSVSVAPAGTIDSIALYQVAAGAPLPDHATAILCAGAAPCAATSGTATLVAPATATTIKASIRTYGTQLVFFTTTAQKAVGGAMRGTLYVTQ